MVSSVMPQPSQLRRVSWITIVIEFAVILFAINISTTHLQNMSPTIMFSGGEFAQFAHSGGYAATVFQRTGKIPLWNPFNYYGEPTSESVTSFVYNPFMMLPLLIYGFIPGTKLGLLIHIAIMAYGGWALGRILNMRSAGRLLLALLLLGSGSMSGQMLGGWYQMVCAQAYIPWVLAGLYGVLYLNNRWSIGVFAVATAFMLFAGVFWYIFPFAASCGLVVLVALIGWDKKLNLLYLKEVRLRRLAWAVGIMLLISALRVLPLKNSLLFAHPTEVPVVRHDFLNLFLNYFREAQSPSTDWLFPWETGHYIITWSLALAILAGRAVIFRNRMEEESRVLIPGITTILVITFISQGNFPTSVWLFQAFPLLQEFRNVPRMMAVASPWIAVIMAMWFDRVWDYFASQFVFLHVEQKLGLVWKKQKYGLLSVGAFIALAGLTFFSVRDIEENWRRNASYISIWDDSRPQIMGLDFLRIQHPYEMLAVESEGLGQRIGYYAPLLRASQGAPDGRLFGVPSTIGFDGMLTIYGRFAVPSNPNFASALADNGYHPMEGAPVFDGVTMDYENPSIPPYAFLLTQETIDKLTNPVTNADVIPVPNYTHRIETIEANVDNYPANSVLVVQDVNYPGWGVTINGQPATLESVGGRLGVRLPEKSDGSPALKILFSYHPTILYIGIIISLIGMLVLSIYLLKLDERFSFVRTIFRKRKGSELVPIPESPFLQGESTPTPTP